MAPTDDEWENRERSEMNEDEIITLRQELADANQRITNLTAQCHRNTEQIGRLQAEAAERDADLRSTQQMVVRADRAVVDAEAERDAMCEVVETAKAVRELWRYDAMAAAEPEIHAFVAAVDALPTTKDGA